jgi:hypothetical protein
VAVAPVPECVDVPPPDSQLSCEEQRAFGKCTTLWMLEGGYCARTCGLPPCAAPPEAEGAVLTIEPGSA